MFENWLEDNYIQILGVITSLIYLYFSVRQKIWLWPFGFLSSALFIYIFFITKFYADMALQVYYLVISIYGWYHWVYGKREDPSEALPVTRITLPLSGILVLLFTGLWIGIALLLIRFTDSELPWGDAFTTAGSIIATWMLARKIIEHWLFWIIIDGVAASLYFYKGLYPTVFLYIIYAVISVLGYFKWRQDLK